MDLDISRCTLIKQGGKKHSRLMFALKENSSVANCAQYQVSMFLHIFIDLFNPGKLVNPTADS